MVSAGIHVSMIGSFEDGTAGAALTRRIPMLATGIYDDTEILLLQTEAIDNLSLESWKGIARLLFEKNGHVVLYRPTLLDATMFILAAAVFEDNLQMDMQDSLFDIPDEVRSIRTSRKSAYTEKAETQAESFRRFGRVPHGYGRHLILGNG